MRLAVIDQQVPPMTLDQPQYPDLRVSTITPANMQLLQQAGAWPELAPTAPTFQHMQVRLVQGEHGKAGCGDWLGGCLDRQMFQALHGLTVYHVGLVGVCNRFSFCL